MVVSAPYNRGVAEPRGFFMRTAILIDGGFFLRRDQSLKGRRTPHDAAVDLHWMCREHLVSRRRPEQSPRRRSQLYRIFYYDCPPLTKKAHDLITGRSIDFSTTPTARWRLQFHDELKKLRKVALRFGYLNERSAHWSLSAGALKQLLGRQITVDQLTADHLVYDVRQKGVDMRIGLDIASMAYKRQVDQMVLVAGDSDFVPAAKLARREGIDFILDPIWAPIRPDLHEHIDGLRTVFPRPTREADPDAPVAESR